MRARYYAPELRRFLNADILKGQISDSTSLNRYSYVNGNPISFVDPFGLSKDIRWNEDETQWEKHDIQWDEDDIKHTWQELGFTYNGSLQDIQRKNAGLPPIQYEQWLKNGYGYSDDNYYFDAILGNYDAIYVADYDALKIVGHSYLLLKKNDGTWLRTHFIGNGDTWLEAKKDAHIETKPINTEKIISRLTKELTSIDILRQTTKTEYFFGFLPVTINSIEIVTVYTSGVQFIPLEGNFIRSIKTANDYVVDDLGKYKNNYNVVSNNCAHYVQQLLREATFSDSELEAFANNSNIMIPANLYTALKYYTTD